jgi:uncharacterized membrane protein YphA (DoxX/SURF4 family)
MKRTTILETIIFFYVILFLYTGITKLTDYGTFKETVADSPILAPIAQPIAWGLPWLEFAVTAMLIIPRWRLKGLYASLVLLIAFTGYVVGLLLFDKQLPCSCGGILQELSWPQHMVFNGIFVLLAIWAIVLQRRENKSQQSNLNINDYRLLGQNEHSSI